MENSSKTWARSHLPEPAHDKPPPAVMMKQVASSMDEHEHEHEHEHDLEERAEIVSQSESEYAAGMVAMPTSATDTTATTTTIATASSSAASSLPDEGVLCCSEGIEATSLSAEAATASTITGSIPQHESEEQEQGENTSYSSLPACNGSTVQEEIGGATHTGDETSCLDREVRRLKVLKSYLGVLRTFDHGIKFDRLTTLACKIFHTKMALVTVADLDKQYCISSRGLDFASIRKSSFCSHAITDATDDILVVLDAARDPRFSDDPQVMGYPRIRFYAGAPLVCSDGYRLGTLCVMDSKPRSDQQFSLEEKQSLVELATMAMETLNDLREKQQFAVRDPSQQIACTAHDLLTPLTGIALSLSLLREDEGLQNKLSDQQKDMIETAANCSSVMNKICHKTMDFFRDQSRSKTQPDSRTSSAKKMKSTVNVSSLVKNLNSIMEPFPKKVPIITSVDPSVPPEFVGDEMKIFRSAANYLTNACAKTEEGSIRLRILKRYNEEQGFEVLFECEDTGPGVDPATYPYLFKPMRDGQGCPINSLAGTVAGRGDFENSGLGLYSVATQISSLGGRYGYIPRSLQSISTSPTTEQRDTKTGSIFWFSVPLQIPPEVKTEVAKKVIPNSNPYRLPVPTPSPSCTIKQLTDPEKISYERKIFVPGLSGTRHNTGLAHKQSQPVTLDRKRMSSSDDFPDAESKGYLSSQVVHRALVIEDSVVVRKSLSRVLVKLGFEVTEVTNGMDGLKELKESLFNLVLCDFLMPIMDGLDCIQQFRQWESANRHHIRQYIVGISAHASDKDIEAGLKVGMDEFRSKPVSFADLTELKDCKQFKRLSEELQTLQQNPCSAKRPKLGDKVQRNMLAQTHKRVCLVIETNATVSKIAKEALENIGWNVASANSIQNAISLLKMRNWDVVLVDDDPICYRCVTMFREWELLHRVNRQKNIILISANFDPMQDASSSLFQVPTGFDGALPKLFNSGYLRPFLDESSSNCNIISR